MTIPLVSVILPVYNAESTLADAIQSIINQTYTDFELIIIDDASTDRTVSIVESFNDSRIRLICKPLNAGLTDSLNVGIQTCQGQLVARMDGDDISMPTRLEMQVAFLKSNPHVSIVGTWFELMPGGELLRTPVSPEECSVWLLRKSVLGHPTVMFRKADLTGAGLRYDPGALHAEDYKLWVDAKLAGLQIGNCPHKLLLYRTHGSQVSVANAKRQAEQTDRIRLEYWKYCFPKSSDGNGDLIRQLMTGQYTNYAEYRKARRLSKALLRENSITRLLDERILKKFLHMNLALGAIAIYRNLDFGTFLAGLTDWYFFRTIVFRAMSSPK